MRRILIFSLLLAVFESSARSNVLFIAVDDLNDWVGYLDGYPGEEHTPNLDRLAAQGTAFVNAHTAVPVCCPSRVAVMSGRLPSTTGIYNNGQWWKPHLPDLKTLPVLFRANGYVAVGAGKIFHHTAGNNPPSQWDQFERMVFTDNAFAFNQPGKPQNPSYPWTSPVELPMEFPYSGIHCYSREVDWGVLPKSEEEYDDALVADYGVTFLGKPCDKPFFLACGFFRPHMPWYAPQKYVDLYPEHSIQLPPAPASDLDDIPKVGRELALRKYDDLARIRAEGKWRRAVQMYLASISFMDAQLGRVLDALEQGPHASDTIIVLWSDHGWHLGEKQHWHKRTLWEEATRVPMIVVAPKVGKPGQRCSEAVSVLDLYPTLVELCGLQNADGWDGESLVPLLRDPKARRVRPAVTIHEKRHVSVRDEEYRYIEYTNGEGELYAHADDPNEWVNRAKDPELAPVIQRLKKWIPSEWAKSAPTKGAYLFDPKTYSWKHKKSGLVTQ